MAEEPASSLEAAQDARVARFERALGGLLLVCGACGAVSVALWLAWLLG